MNSAEKEAVLHCLKSMIDEEVCEECPLYGTTGTDHCENDCVRLAINVLEQYHCGDAISRQAAIDAVKFGITHAIRINKYTGEKDDLFQASNEELEKAIERIGELPTVSTEKTGHWNRQPQIDKFRNYYRCSVCGKGDTYLKFNFCPNCGAKMEVEEC